MNSCLLTQNLLLIDRTASNGVGAGSAGWWIFDLKHLTEDATGFADVLAAFTHPELLDPLRDRMSYVPKAAATLADLERSEKRLVVWAIDWVRLLTELEEMFSAKDQVRRPHLGPSF